MAAPNMGFPNFHQDDFSHDLYGKVFDRNPKAKFILVWFGPIFLFLYFAALIVGNEQHWQLVSSWIDLCAPSVDAATKIVAWLLSLLRIQVAYAQSDELKLIYHLGLVSLIYLVLALSFTSVAIRQLQFEEWRRFASADALSRQKYRWCLCLVIAGAVLVQAYLEVRKGLADFPVSLILILPVVALQALWLETEIFVGLLLFQKRNRQRLS